MAAAFAVLVLNAAGCAALGWALWRRPGWEDVGLVVFGAGVGHGYAAAVVFGCAAAGV